MPASELIERVARLIEANAERFQEGPRAEIEELGTRLREPLRIAIVGRVKAGKSTLVNAVLGQRVAPTDVSECTRVVTWFTYGRPERVVIRMRDGSELATQLADDGMLPRELPVPLEQVASIRAHLANASLRSMTLIDTPGLGSVHEEYSRATEELLARSSTEAASAADAVVFILGNAVMADEVETLKLFQESDGNGDGGSAANAVGVLSRADQLSDGTRDSWDVAVELAGRYAESFTASVATVVPVAGLIAETAEAAMLTERDAGAVNLLAKLDPASFDRLLWSADRFVGAEVAEVDPDTRERLLGLLDLYGIRVAVQAVRQGATSATALRKQLSRTSGISTVKQTFGSYFSDQDHVLKVRSVLDALGRLAFTYQGKAPADALARLRSEVEQLHDDPVMHPIAELEVLHAANRGRVKLPPDLDAEMRKVFAPASVQTRLGVETDDPEAMREAARSGMARWRTFMLSAGPSEGHAARVVTRSYQLIWKSIV